MGGQPRHAVLRVEVLGDDGVGPLECVDRMGRHHSAFPKPFDTRAFKIAAVADVVLPACRKSVLNVPAMRR